MKGMEFSSNRTKTGSLVLTHIKGPFLTTEVRNNRAIRRCEGISKDTCNVRIKHHTIARSTQILGASAISMNSIQKIWC